MQTGLLPQQQLYHFRSNRAKWVGGFIAVVLCLYLIIGQEWVPMLDILDKKMMLVLNFKGAPLTDHFWYGYSHLWGWWPFIVAVLAEVWRNSQHNWRDFAVFLVATALLVTLLDQTSSSIIKPLVGRLRPSHDPAIREMLHYVNNYHGGSYGFVSGHATNIVGLATWIGLIFRHRLTRAILALFAILMCYSRIYLGVHYPGDVLCGALLGYGIARLAFLFLAPYMPACLTTRLPYSIPIAFCASLCLILLIP